MDINQQSLRSLYESLGVAIVCTIVPVLIIIFMGISSLDELLNPLEFAAVFTSYACTYMVVKQSRWNYIIAIITTALYSLLFWQNNLLASMALNIYLIPTVIYGYFIWGKDNETKPVNKFDIQTLPVYFLAVFTAYIGAIYVVKYFGGSLAPIDSVILIGSIFAQFLLDRKILTTWMVWAFVNVISIYVYFRSGLYLVGIQYIFFLFNTAYGHYSWNQSMKGIIKK